MNYRILPNGDLLLTAGNSDRSELSEWRAKGYSEAESFIAECLHERLYFVRPETIAALTDAPILCDDMDFSDEMGEFRPYPDAKIWWYPDYMVSDPWQKLATRGRVQFTKAESV